MKKMNGIKNNLTIPDDEKGTSLGAVFGMLGGLMIIDNAMGPIVGVLIGSVLGKIYDYYNKKK